MRRTEFIMGMPIVLEVEQSDSARLFDSVFDRLNAIDQQFSPYVSSSEVNLYRRDELMHLSPSLRRIISACQKAERDTDGYFSAWAGGEFDPSGYVKGWAIAEAAKILGKSDIKTFCLSAGGDILAKSGGSKIWRIGIQDPTDRTRLIARLEVKNLAIATSGSYERGDHIINPKNKRSARYWSSLTVVGPDIITADVLATASFAAGRSGLDLIKSRSDYEALAVRADDGEKMATSGFAGYCSSYNQGNNRP